MYGWFWHWLCYQGGAAFSDELAAALARHAQGKIQIFRSAFPSVPRDNNTITLVQAARMCHTRSGTLRKLLAAEDLIRIEKRRGSPVMVQLSTARRIARDLEDSINLKRVGRLIGVSRTSLHKLTRSNRVPVWMRGGGNEKHHYVFRWTEIIFWLRTLIPDAPSVTVIPDGMIRAADTPRAANIAITVLVDAIASGEINVGALLGGERNLRGALVRLETVRAYRNSLGAKAVDPRRHYIKTRIQCNCSPLCTP